MTQPRHSIAKRVRAVILLTSVMVLLATAGAFSVYELINFKRQLVSNLKALATVVADSSAAALAMNQQPDAETILGTLQVEKDIKRAVLYTNSGAIFATFPTNVDRSSFEQPVAAPDGRFADGVLLLSHPVIHEGNTLGTLYLRRSLEGLYKQFWRFGEIVAAVLIGSSAMAFFLSSLLQPHLRSILALTQAAQAVAEHEDYSVRRPEVDRRRTGRADRRV